MAIDHSKTRDQRPIKATCNTVQVLILSENQLSIMCFKYAKFRPQPGISK
jgi:hypothetical protein